MMLDLESIFGISLFGSPISMRMFKISTLDSEIVGVCFGKFRRRVVSRE